MSYEKIAPNHLILEILAHFIGYFIHPPQKKDHTIIIIIPYFIL